MATVWTVAIEAAVAAAFLWPAGRGLSRYRDALLLLFCITTFAVAPVAGFGWLLIALGVAQSDLSGQRTRGIYLATFVLILFYRDLPWAP